MLPNFFVVGAPKAGTTSLYNYLDQHPQIYMSPVKEPCFFASEVRPEAFRRDYRRYVIRQNSGRKGQKRFSGLISEWKDYLSLFDQAEGYRAVGEASVCYLWSASA